MRSHGAPEQDGGHNRLSAADEARIGDLIDEYELAIERGDDVTPEELCAHEPHLLSSLKRAIDNLHAIEQRLRQGEMAQFPSMLGEFTLLEQIGMGGSGVVFRCQQHSTNREVALKIFRPTFDPNEQERRFRRELRAISTLQVQRVPTVYSTGVREWNGRPCFWIAMELIKGKTIIEHVRSHSYTHFEILQLFIKVCETLQQAHRHVEVHRDLKPANILVTDAGEPYILDFGVAKIAAPSGSDQTTESAGLAVGTAAWMAPEVMLGNTADTRSDLFSLGVILFQMFTNQHPYDAESQNIAQISKRLHDDPMLRVSQIVKTIPRDIDLFVAHLLEIDPAKRYQNLDEVIADANHLLNKEPISVRRVSTIEHVFRWCRSHAMSSASIILACLSVVTGVVWNYAHSLKVQEYANKLELKTKELTQTIDFRERAVVASRLLNIQDHLAEAPMLAREQLEDPDAFPIHLRDFAWNYLRRSTEIEHFETSSLDGDINSIRIANHTPLIATIGGSTILRLRHFHKERRIFIANGYLHRSDIRFSPDDTTLFAVLIEGGIVELRTSDGTLAGRYFEDEQLSGRIALSGDGNQLVAFSTDDKLLYHNLSTGETRSSEVRGSSDFIGVWFLPDEKIGGLTRQGMWVVWDEATLSQVERQDLSQLHEEVKGLAFADFQNFPNGEVRLAMARKNNSTIVASFNREKPQIVDAFSFRSTSLDGVHFRSSSELFIARKDGGELRDLSNRQTLRTIRKLSSPVESSALAREQNLIALGTHDGTTHLFGLELPSLISAHFFHKSNDPSRKLTGIPLCTTNQENCFVYTGLSDGSLAVFDLNLTALKGGCKIGNAPVRAICLSRDQQTLYCGLNVNRKGEIRSYPVSEVQALISMQGSKANAESKMRSLPVKNVQALKVSENDRFLFVGSRDGSVFKVDTKQWKFVHQWDAHTGGTFALECVADQVISAGTDGMICVWDQKSGELLHQWEAHTGRVHDLRYHSKLKRLYSASHDGTIAIWNMSGTLVRRMSGHYSHVRSLALSANGASLATGAGDGSLFIWDALTGDLQLEIKAHRAEVRSILFSKWKLVSASRDGSIKIWSSHRNNKIAHE